jgi:hypothetical protein
MEILRFEEATSPAPKRKKSSKGFLTISFVAVLFGVGSAFATTTVAINGGQGVSLGQGVTLAAACDERIGIVPITTMELFGETEPLAPTFFLRELEINDIEAQRRTPATETEDAVNGCGGQFFDIQIFNTATTPTAYPCAPPAGPDFPMNSLEFDGDVKVYEVTRGDPDVEVEKIIDCDGSTLSFEIIAKDDGDRDYKIVFVRAPSAISYITLVSRES